MSCARVCAQIAKAKVTCARLTQACTLRGRLEEYSDFDAARQDPGTPKRLTSHNVDYFGGVT
ncbi:hypothetical protein PSAC2689_110081 [Paraburkholderia sacchari]